MRVWAPSGSGEWATQDLMSVNSPFSTLMEYQGGADVMMIITLRAGMEPLVSRSSTKYVG